MIDHKHKLVYIHLPKTGGNTISMVFDWKWGTWYLDGESHYDDDLTDEICDKYFMFTFVRNPFDKFVSTYWFWKKRLDLEFDFEYFCSNSKDLFIELGLEVCHIWTQTYLNGQDNRWKFVDYIGRFETFDKDLFHILDVIGVKKPVTIPIINQSFHGKSEKHYSEYYTEETKSIVEDQYKEDLGKFNYEFEELING